MEVSANKITELGISARLQNEEFCYQTMKTLVKQYEEMRKSEEFIEESLRKELDDQYLHASKEMNNREMHMKLFEMMSLIFKQKE